MLQRQRPPVKTVSWHFDVFNLLVLLTELSLHFKDAQQRGTTTKGFLSIQEGKKKKDFAL